VMISNKENIKLSNLSMVREFFWRVSGRVIRIASKGSRGLYWYITRYLFYSLVTL
jgi:hypothetical protein